MTIRAFAGVMQSLYKENDYPSDRLVLDQNSLAAFTEAFNTRTSGNYLPEEVASEIARIRKDKMRTGGLPHIGRSFSGPTIAMSSSDM